MIISYPFGYALRHKIYYNTDIKRGTITLWSSYNGSAIGTDPVANGDGFLSELFAYQNAYKGTFGANQYTEFQVGDEKDVFSILAALVIVKAGRVFSFISKEGRNFSFSMGREGKTEKEIITAKIQYGPGAKLTLGEANKLETYTREILHDLGFSNQEISERLEHIAKESLI